MDREMNSEYMKSDDIATTKLLLTVKEAATLLGCSRATIYGLISGGELAVIAVGRSRGYRIDRRDLDEFLRRRKYYRESEKPAPPVQRPQLKHIRL
jgi:excisionase family DNA binding protein